MIDVHQHILPDVYTESLKKTGIELSGGARFPEWDLDAQLETMNRRDIAAAMFSISSPGIFFGDRTFADDLARRKPPMPEREALSISKFFLKALYTEKAQPPKLSKKPTKKIRARKARLCLRVSSKTTLTMFRRSLLTGLLSERAKTSNQSPDVKHCFKDSSNWSAQMNRAGVGIMAGSDFADKEAGIQPGFDLHDELALFVEAGMSPMQALQTATLNPAKFLGLSKSLGTIEKGKMLIWFC